MSFKMHIYTYITSTGKLDSTIVTKQNIEDALKCDWNNIYLDLAYLHTQNIKTPLSTYRSSAGHIFCLVPRFFITKDKRYDSYTLKIRNKHEVRYYLDRRVEICEH